MSDMPISRGAVVRTSLDKQRPAVVMSADWYNGNARCLYVQVIPLKTLKDGRRPRRDQVLILPPEGGLRYPSVTDTNQLQPVYREQLLRYYGRVSDNTMRQIEKRVAMVLGLGAVSSGEAAVGVTNR